MTDDIDCNNVDKKPRRGAPKGNQFWKARTKHGREKLFASADLLWEACCEYFQWVEDNPLWEDKVTQYQGGVVDLPICKMRAMTIGGLCIFLDIHRGTWNEWRNNKDFSEVIEKAELVIYEQKFTGAAAELLNPNIIARDLGLRDASDVKHSGSVDINQMTDEELNNKLLALMNESGNTQP